MTDIINAITGEVRSPIGLMKNEFSKKGNVSTMAGAIRKVSRVDIGSETNIKKMLARNNGKLRRSQLVKLSKVVSSRARVLSDEATEKAERAEDRFSRILMDSETIDLIFVIDDWSKKDIQNTATLLEPFKKATNAEKSIMLAGENKYYSKVYTLVKERLDWIPESKPRSFEISAALDPSAPDIICIVDRQSVFISKDDLWFELPNFVDGRVKEFLGHYDKMSKNSAEYDLS